MIADWTPKTYDVVYKWNASTTTADQIVTVNGVKYDSSLTLGSADTFTNRKGYRVSGWATSDLEKTTYTPGETITKFNPKDDSVSQVVFVANWTEIEYTINFTLGAGESLNADHSGIVISGNTGTYKVSTDVKLPTASKSGRVFKGWKVSEVTADANGNCDYTADQSITSMSLGSGKVGSLTLVTVFENDFYLVTLNANKANGTTEDPSALSYKDVTYTFDSTSNTWKNGSNVLSESIEYSKTYAFLQNLTPTRNGYTFAGWWTEATAGTQIAYTSVLSTASDHTLYAHWTAKDITITYSENKASGSTGAITNMPEAVTLKFNANYTIPETNPTRAGYTFGGWYLDSACSDDKQITSTTQITSYVNHSLFAKWTKTSSKYKVNYYTENVDNTSGTLSTSN